MRAEAQIPHADEALRALFQRFKESPGTAFEELAEALLARGHAAEALQITEHGLQINPSHATGRVERAAALLALGRPKVAYVELVRALAIEPGHTRGLRLLGKVFVEAGIPERAAALLKKRFAATAAPSLTVDARALNTKAGLPPEPSAESLATLAPGEPEATQDVATSNIEADIPELFASLTKDLGLGAAIDESMNSRVEVTQVVRLRRGAITGREDELSSIEGPIVDSTQPGQLEYETIDQRPPRGDFLYDVVTSPALAATAGDEPLFNESGAPFAGNPARVTREPAAPKPFFSLPPGAVAPVFPPAPAPAPSVAASNAVSVSVSAAAAASQAALQLPAPPADEPDTLHDDEPNPIDLEVLKNAIDNEAERTRSSQVESTRDVAPTDDLSALPPSEASYLKRFERSRGTRESAPPGPAPSSAASSGAASSGAPFLGAPSSPPVPSPVSPPLLRPAEKAAENRFAGPPSSGERLNVVRTKQSPKWIVLAIFVALLLIGFAVGVVLLAQDDLAAWLPGHPAQVERGQK